MTVREGTDADVPAIVALVNLAYLAEAFIVSGGRVSEQGVRARLARARGAWLVIDDGEPRPSLTGAIFVEALEARGHFGPLAVDPSAQGRGVGKRLVAAAEAWCRARGCSEMELEVVSARTELPAFYRALGYADVGRAPFPEPDKLLGDAHLVVMRRSLE